MIVFKNISKVYKLGKLEVRALKNINLNITRGEMVAIGGVSGSGKSTLLNLLGAMDKPTEGSISMDGEDITNYSSAKLTAFRAKKIDFIFQNFNLISALNVYENIIVPLILKGQKYQKQKIIKLINVLGLGVHIKHRPDELSAGQRQRVAIARALAHSPPIILADEPTANLDKGISLKIIDLLKRINTSMNVTIIIASHDPNILNAIGNRITLEDGEIVFLHNNNDNSIYKKEVTYSYRK